MTKSRVLLACAVSIALHSNILTSQAPRVRDSAGVRIVENGARRTAPVAFTLAPTPTIDFGGTKTNPDDEFKNNFFGYRVLRLSNGHYAVSEWTRIRLYDATGKVYKTIGRDGAGPGEFRQVFNLCVTIGDTLVVHDNMNAKLAIWDRDGKLVRETRFSGVDLARQTCFADGTILSSVTGPEDKSEVTRTLQRRRLDTSIANELGIFWAHDASFSIYPRAGGSFTAGSDRFFVGDSRTSQVKVYDLAGKLVSIIRTSDEADKVTAAESEAMRPMAVGSNGSGTVPDRPKPTIWPVYAGIQTDPAGRLWMQDVQKLRTDPLRWTAFDRDGKMLGKFQIAAQVKAGDPMVMAFTAEGVVIRREDADGALHLSVFRLIPVR